MQFILPIIEAQDELQRRVQEASLTPDRYKQLLMLSGVDESKAETERAKLELSMSTRGSNATGNPVRINKRLHR